MSDTEELAEELERLRVRIEEDPDAVSVAELVQRIEPADVSERREIVTLLDRKITADPSIAATLLDTVEWLFDHENNDIRTVAATIVEQLAGRYPKRAAPAVEHLSTLLHDEYPFARRHAVWALAHISEPAPDLVAPLVPDLRPAEDEPVYFEQEHIIILLRNVANTDLDAITPLIPALLEALESVDGTAETTTEGVHSPGMEEQFDTDQFQDSIDVSLTAAELVAETGESAPDELIPYVEDLIAVHEAVSRETVRRELVRGFAALAREDPAAVEPTIPVLATALGARDVALQSHAARALGLLAAVAPEAVANAAGPRVDELEPLLREGTPPVQAAVAGLLSYVTEEDPVAVEPVVEALIASLGTEDRIVRASAAIALGYAGGADARSALVDLLDEDLDSDLRVTIRDAVDRIESRGCAGSGTQDRT